MNTAEKTDQYDKAGFGPAFFSRMTYPNLFYMSNRIALHFACRYIPHYVVVGVFIIAKLASLPEDLFCLHTHFRFDTHRNTAAG